MQLQWLTNIYTRSIGMHPFMVRPEIVVIIWSVGMAACGSDKVLYLLSEGPGNVGTGIWFN